jgi:uncharacterized protein (DUF2384 family)
MPTTETNPNASPNASPNGALDVFFKIADAWKLTIEQQIMLLGAPARSTFYKWKKEGGLLSTDTEDRISHLAAIYKSLQIVVPDPHAADTWIGRPNKYFGGRTALDVMLDGKLTDIYSVRVYLDAQRGG